MNPQLGRRVSWPQFSAAWREYKQRAANRTECCAVVESLAEQHHERQCAKRLADEFDGYGDYYLRGFVDGLNGSPRRTIESRYVQGHEDSGVIAEELTNRERDEIAPVCLEILALIAGDELSPGDDLEPDFAARLDDGFEIYEDN